MTTSSHHLLIVDDAREIREPLGQYMRKQGFRVTLAADAAEARLRIADSAIDLVILDLMMPGEDGLSLCRWLVASADIPIILLTAMATDTDRIVGLEMGADDYVVKPFNPRELLARTRAVLRRRPAVLAAETGQCKAFAGWVHNPNTASLHHGKDVAIKLTTSENRLLSFLLERPNAVHSRAVLLDHVVGREEKAYDRAIDNQVLRLRTKIEADPSDPLLLVTEWGGGYKLAADVEDVNCP